MKREVIIRIDSCKKCPYYMEDDNVTRALCKESNGEFLWWYDSPEEDAGEIPEWCHLLINEI